MLSILLGLIDPISRIAGKIADARVALANASTDQERIRAEERIKALEANAEVLKAESAGSRINQYVRLALSIPAIFILWKLEIWDRGFGWGWTHELSTEEWTYIWMVCGFYLLNRAIQVARR